MSEQMKRYAAQRLELLCDGQKWDGLTVVMAADYDALEQQFRELEADNSEWEKAFMRLAVCVGGVAQAKGGLKDEQSLGDALTWMLGTIGERDTLRAEVDRVRKDVERLAWMFDEECNVRSYMAQDGVRYDVVWSELGESQDELFFDPRTAIDAAMAAKEVV